MSLPIKHKIAVLISDTNLGGTETYLRSYIPHLDRNTFDVCVVATGPEPLAAEIGALADTYHNIKMGSFPRMRTLSHGRLVPDFAGILRLPIWFIVSVYRLARLIKKEKIELIHSHGIHFNLLAGLACKITGVPAICHVHAPPKLKYPWSGWLAYGYLGAFLADRFVSVSQFAASQFHRSWKRKVSIVPNAIDCEHIKKHKKNGELRKMSGLTDKDFVVGNVSIVQHRKGLERFFELARSCQENGRDYKFVLIAGTYSDISKTIMSELKHKYHDVSNVIIIENLKQAMLYLGDMDIFFMCSRPGTETFGLVVIEAMAAGTPALAFKNDAMPEIIDNGVNGFLVPDNDIHRVCKILDEFHNDVEKQNSIRLHAVSSVAERFDINAMCHKLETLYNEMIKL